MAPLPMSHLHFWTHFNYYLFKLWLLLVTGLPHPVLHIYLGLLIQISVCWALRLRISHATPLFFVYFAEFYNELNDLFVAVPAINRDWWVGTAIIPIPSSSRPPCSCWRATPEYWVSPSERLEAQRPDS